MPVRDFPCEEDWVYNEASNSCILVVHTTTGQADSVANCRNMGAELIEVRNAEAQSWIDGYLVDQGELTIKFN